MEITTVKAQPRQELGSKYTRRLRTSGRLPAIIYGHGETPEPISLDTHEVKLALGHGTHLLSVELDGGARPCLIKQVQFDHLQHDPIHLDLARVDLNERVKVRVGIELRGTPKGLGHGGILEQLLADVEVECLVTEIPEMIRPNVAHLHLGDVLHVKELVAPPGVKILAEPEAIVASVRVLAVEEPVAVATEGEAAPTQPEVIGRGKEEEVEAAGEEKKAEKKPEKKEKAEKK
ncbi:MAG TPA: 50S ribosomal protein L25 [Phycisphaerae bacterium]|jgi:large subunit ribosomal protein L25